MIIDLIIDRNCGDAYDPKTFYRRVTEYGNTYITYAMDYGDDFEVKRELIRYLIDNDYNIMIAGFVESVSWLLPQPSREPYPPIGRAYNDGQYQLLVNYYKVTYDI